MSSPAEIGYFRVTNREFEQSLEAVDLNKRHIMNLPIDAKIAEIGSGLDQEFANGVKSIRPDVKVISLDPTLGLENKDFYTTTEESPDHGIRSVQYKYNDPEINKSSYADSLEKQQETKRKRLESAHETGGVVAGLAPEIPFADESLDLLVDSWGPGLYLDRYEEGSELEIYLNNISRSLKNGGEAHIYPIDFYDEVLESNKIKNEKAEKEYEKILENTPNVKYEFFKKDDKGLPEGQQDRLGIKITKVN